MKAENLSRMVQMSASEDRIRNAKDSGLGRFPSRDFAINTAWAQLVAISADLIAWLRLLALTPQQSTRPQKSGKWLPEGTRRP